MSSSAFDSHLRSILPWVHQLRLTQRHHPVVLGVIAVESFHRNRRFRLLEYAAWALLSVVRSGRVRRLSVGAAQMRLQHWADARAIDDVWFSWRSFRVITAVEANYDITARHLTALFPTGIEELADVAQHYTGGRSLYYALRVRDAMLYFDPEIRWAHID